MSRRYSQSSIRSAGCPKLFLHRLDAPRVGSQSVLANLGTGLHRFGQLYQAHCLNLGVQTDVACARNLAAQCLAGSGLDAEHFDDLLGLAELFAEQEVVDPARETSFEQTLEAGRFFGTPDKLVILDRDPQTQEPTAIEIDDYKSGWKLPSHEECQKDIQLWLYDGLALARYPAVRHFTNRYIYLRRGKDRRFEVTVEQVRAFMTDMEALAYTLDDIKEPIPRGGQLCDFCEIATSCSLVTGGMVRALTSPEQAVKAAEFLRALTGAKRELESRLRPWISQSGPIRLADGSELGYHPVNKSEYNPLEILTWAAKNTKLKAADIMQCFKIGKVGLARLARLAGLNARSKKELGSLRWQSSSDQFGFKKPKGGPGAIEASANQGLLGDPRG